MKIGVIGTGYVGLVASVCFADAGHQLFCVDSDPEKLARLQKGQVPFYEPGLEDLFKLNLKRMKFLPHVSEAVTHSDVIFIAVGTPELPDGSADMSFTFNVLEEVCKSAQSPKYVVLKSTVPIGTARKAQAFCNENASVKLEIINNPEFLRQGAALEDFLKPDRVVIGHQTEEAKKIMTHLYEPFLKNNHPILFMDNTSAEMTKYAANAFLALKISFINELALLSDQLGADIDKVREGFTSDNRINPAFFYPGIGYGGSCFPKDVRALMHIGKQQDLDLLLLKAADEVNERQKTILANRLINRLGSLKGKTIGLWGLAFKPRTDDVRRAPSLKLIEDLVAKGAQVQAYDPVASENAVKSCKTPFKVCETAMDAAKNADALLIVTEWTEFKTPNLSDLKSSMNSPLIFDGRNIFDPKMISEAGFEYYGIGRQMRKDFV
ncbi:MAG: UDP-glucose/GDP-mannose dehydrogenase family protein [Bdellovibrionales bacterium]|nr:UDP-glucose/GDP-mannose dehydrogenase family protein [Bdellovibrionales bacterium]